jgi:polyhydroxyalkanoate synthesis regulator phasin
MDKENPALHEMIQDIEDLTYEARVKDIDLMERHFTRLAKRAPNLQVVNFDQHRAKLDKLADLLVQKETLDRDEVAAFFADVAKRAPREPEIRGAGLAVSRQAQGREPPAPGYRT